MRIFATFLFDTALLGTVLPGWEYKTHRDHAANILECCEDLADALAAGVTGSLLEAYVTAAATGVAVEYVLPCEISVLSCAPLEARDANPAK